MGLEKVKLLQVLLLIILLVQILNGCSKTASQNEMKIASGEKTKLVSQLESIDARVFCKVDLNENGIKAIQEKIETCDNVEEYKIISRKDAYKIAVGTDKKVEGIDENIFPISFQVKLKDINLKEAFYNEFKAVDGVERVLYSKTR